MPTNSSQLLDVLTSQLDPSTMRRIGAVIGADPQATSKAVAGALPVLLGALQRNASQPAGAGALLGALTRDHDGSLLDDLGGFLSGIAGAGTAQAPASRTQGLGLGEAILGHVLGGKTSVAANQLGRASGLDAQAVMKLLALLAPIVMGALGKVQRQQGLGQGDLTDLLNQTGRQFEQRAPQAGPAGAKGGLGDLVGSILDRDGDGSAMDDIARIGTGVLGSLLGGGKR